MKKLNLVVIMADQLRFDLLGAHTPHLNALLGESCLFERGYCASPLCAPARGAFFTGLRPNRNGCLINPWAPQDRDYGRVKAATPNLYRLLEDDWDGWHTGKQHLFTADNFDRDNASKIHWLSLENGYAAHLEAAGQVQPGGARFKGLMPETVGGITRARSYSVPATGCYAGGLENFFDGYILQQSLEAIEARDQNKPFFLSAMFLAPHPPLEIPEPYYSRVRPDEIELPANVGQWSRGQSPLQLYNLPGYFGSRYQRDDWREIWRVYAGLVALLDDCVGQIIERLREHNLYDDSLIIFTSDHGEMLGSHCLWQKMCCYQESIRTPISFKPPRGEPFVERRDDLVSHLDVLPTICDYLGVPAPPDMDGTSARAAIEGRKAHARETVWVQFDGNGALGNFSRCVIRGPHKLIVDWFKDELFFELYHLEDDPQEQNNLAFDRTEKARELIESLRHNMSATGDHLRLAMGDYEKFLVNYRAHCAPQTTKC